MTLIHNDGTTKELDSKAVSMNPWPTVLGILLLLSLGLNFAQFLKINMLDNYIKGLETINKMYKEDTIKKKPVIQQQNKDLVKSPTKVKVTPKEVVKVKEPVKVVYKEYTPLISSDATLINKSNEVYSWTNTQLNQNFDKMWFAEGERLFEHEKLLINELNSDLSILLDVQPTVKSSQFVSSTPQKTKLQKFRKIAIPIAISLAIQAIF